MLFTSIQPIKNRKKVETILPHIAVIRDIYRTRGFKVTHLLTDTEFSVLRNPLMAMGITLNVTSADEHVPEIERNIRYLKEKVRGTVNSLPFRVLPRVLLKAIIYDATKWMNMFPRKAGIPNMSPRSIITGLGTDVNIHCRVPIGSYCHVHDEPHPSNTNIPRSTGAIALHAQGNVQGGYNFINLTTWKLMQRRSWSELPTPSNVIKQVEARARKEMKLRPDDVIPDQIQFRRRDKSIVEDIINPEIQDEGADDAVSHGNSDDEDNHSNSDNDDDSQGPDAGAQQDAQGNDMQDAGASQEDLGNNDGTPYIEELHEDTIVSQEDDTSIIEKQDNEDNVSHANSDCDDDSDGDDDENPHPNDRLCPGLTGRLVKHAHDSDFDSDSDSDSDTSGTTLMMIVTERVTTKMRTPSLFMVTICDVTQNQVLSLNTERM